MEPIKIRWDKKPNVIARVKNWFGGGYVPTPIFANAISIGTLLGSSSGNNAGLAYANDPSQHSVVAACIRLLADTVSQTDFQVGATFGRLQEEPRADHPAADVLNNPIGISKSELIYGIIEGLIANGNAYLIPSRMSGLRLVDWLSLIHI